MISFTAGSSSFVMDMSNGSKTHKGVTLWMACSYIHSYDLILESYIAMVILDLVVATQLPLHFIGDLKVRTLE